VVAGPKSRQLPLYGGVQLLLTPLPGFQANQRTLLVSLTELPVILLIQITQPPVKVDIQERLPGGELLRGDPTRGTTGSSGGAGYGRVFPAPVKTQQGVDDQRQRSKPHKSGDEQ
jgi:hypothetical protein